MARTTKEKYKLKDKVGGYLALTSPGFECIIKKGEEKELTTEEAHRVKDFVEKVVPVPAPRKVKARVIDTNVEDNE